MKICRGCYHFTSSQLTEIGFCNKHKINLHEKTLMESNCYIQKQERENEVDSIDIEEFQSKVGLVAEVLKGSLESFNLYIAIDTETKEFLFIDRDSWNNGGSCKVARVAIDQINVR